MKSNRYADFSASRRLWNQFFTCAVWIAAILVTILVVGIIGMVLVRGLPHVNWTFLTTTSSILKGTNGILPAILNTLYIILLTLIIVLPLGVGAAVYLTEYATNHTLIAVIEFTNETLAGIPQHHLRPGGHAGVRPGPGLPDQPAVGQPDPGDYDPAHHHPHHPGIPENRPHGLP